MLASGHPGLKILYSWLYTVCVCVCTCAPVLRCSIMSDSSWPNGLSPTRLLRPWDSPGKNTGVDCHALLQEIFPTQGSSPRSPALQQDFLPSEPPGKPYSTLYSTQKHHHLWGACTWQRTPEAWTNLRDWTREHTLASLKVHNLRAPV